MPECSRAMVRYCGRQTGFVRSYLGVNTGSDSGYFQIFNNSTHAMVGLGGRQQWRPSPSSTAPPEQHGPQWIQADGGAFFPRQSRHRKVRPPSSQLDVVGNHRDEQRPRLSPRDDRHDHPLDVHVPAPANNTLAFSTGSAKRVRITSSGGVGDRHDCPHRCAGRAPVTGAGRNERWRELRVIAG